MSGPERRPRRRFADLAAVLVIAAGLAVQFVETRSRSLSPDEALHVELSHLPRVADVYQRVRWNAHPPLFFLFLRLWLRLGHSELFLRLPPALFGAGFLWFFYRWTNRVFATAASLVALVVAAAALATLEIAAETAAPGRLVLFSLLLYLAILTHYAAFFIAVSLAAYAPLRLRRSGRPRRMLAIWAASQVGAALLYLFLYVTQVTSLRGGDLERQAVTGWLRPAYFHPDQEGAIPFLVRQTGELFLYFFGLPAVAAGALLLAGAGLIALAIGRRPVMVLLTLPLLLAWATALAGLYPFGGTRHCIYLLPFVSAAIGASLSALATRRFWPGLLAPLALVLSFPRTTAWPTSPGSLARTRAAVDQIRNAAPSGSLLFSDYRTGAILTYYLGRERLGMERQGLDSFWESDAGGYCIVRSPLWTPEPKTLEDEIEKMIALYGLSAGQRFWVIRLGLEFDPKRELSRRLPNAVFPASWRFGDLSILEVWL